MSARKLVVMVERARRDKIADVVTALMQEGMTVEQQLDSIGIITGHADDTAVTALEGVEGVRQGKMIELDLSETDAGKAEAQVKDMCEKLLANTVIESYSVDIA